MKNKILLPLFVFALFAIPLNSFAQQNEKNLDQIVAVVNDHIILKSDVDQQVQQYLMQLQQQQGRRISFSEEMWYTILQSTVDRYVMLDQAERDSITVSDEIVDQQINRQINSYVQQIGSEEELERELGKSLIEIRADLRENYREQMVVERFQQQVRQDVQITRPEVKEYFESIPKDSLPTIPEQVAVSQIVAIPPALEDARTKARELAEQLRDSVINHGKTIEELAKKYGDGPNASNGGKLPMVNLNDLVAEYSAAAANLEPGGISQVVETSFGFHVIRLNKREGDQIDTNHILISVDDESYNDEAAKNKLEQIADSVRNHNHKDISFADMARRHSEDPNTAPLGGRILNPQSGERLLALDELDPALYRIVLLLDEEGEISEPKEYTLEGNDGTSHAYRIIHLDKRVPEHTANLEDDYRRIKNAALQDKQRREINKLIEELRDEMYVEFKIKIPKKYEEAELDTTSQ